MFPEFGTATNKKNKNTFVNVKIFLGAASFVNVKIFLDAASDEPF